MTAELHLVSRCEEHGEIGRHHIAHIGAICPGWCDGGSVTVLDPERYLIPPFVVGSEYVGNTIEFTVQDAVDVLDALEAGQG